ncbi:MAG: Mov34/MPN/PAD-1 family protein [Pirellulaceae bacterium]
MIWSFIMNRFRATTEFVSIDDQPADDLSALAMAAREARRHPKARGREETAAGTRRQVDANLPIWLMKIEQSAYNEMLSYLSAGVPERAGILLGPVADDSLVTHFIPDLTGESSSASFRLDVESLNRELKNAKLARMNCKGIAHSHPTGITQPSCGDLAYLERLFALPANADAVQFFVPIITGGRVFPYVFSGGAIWPTAILLV